MTDRDAAVKIFDAARSDLERHERSLCWTLDVMRTGADVLCLSCAWHGTLVDMPDQYLHPVPSCPACRKLLFPADSLWQMLIDSPRSVDFLRRLRPEPGSP